MTREQPERKIKGCQHEFIPLNAGSRTERKQHGLQLVSTKFGQFLQRQLQTILVHELHHVKVLVMVQPIVKKHDLVFKKFNQHLNVETASSLGFQTGHFSSRS